MVADHLKLKALQQRISLEAGLGLSRVYAAGPQSSRGQQLWSPARPGGPFLTLIARLPDLTARVQPLLDLLCHEEPDQYHYPPGDVHVTLFNLDHAATDLPAVMRSVTQTFYLTTPLRLAFGQVGASRQTVYLPAAETSGQLRKWRRRLRTETGLNTRIRQRATDGLVFANLLRFQAPVQRRSLSQQLRRLPAMPSLHLDVGHVELVITDKVLSAAATTQLLSLSTALSHPDN